MRIRFALALAWRESKSTWRRIGLYMSSITLGVAALVAINSFRSGLIDSVDRESRALLGADLRLSSGRPFSDSIQAAIDGARRDGTQVATMVNTVSMAMHAATMNVRLVQVRAITGGYPFYGSVVTRPAGAYATIQDGQNAVVDPAVLSQLDASVGDTLFIGEAPFLIVGTIEHAPSDIGFRNAIGPRVMIGGQYLEATGLLRFGSLAQRQAFFKFENEAATQRYVDARHALFRRHMIDFDTAREQSDNLGEALSALTRFLGLVGLTALLLGGVGVASAVNVFIKEKRATIATLRCIGATQQEVFGAYLMQAVVLALAGAVGGVILGVAIQAILPAVLESSLPIDITFQLNWVSIATGLGVGIWVAVLFALLPLLSIRGISPLQALRSDYEAAVKRDFARVGVMIALVASVLAISWWQAADYRPALGYAGGMAVTLSLLWFTAWLLMKVTRRLFPRRSRFVFRQGIANLFRPRNQTVSVILSLGFGVFLIATIYLVQNNLLNWLEIENSPTAPNVLAFDVQRDQAEDVRTILARHSVVAPELTPIVPARISHINGALVRDILADTVRAKTIEPWALRREYRHTYRDSMTIAEELIEGEFFGADAVRDGVSEISIEADVAESLALKLNDRVTWDVQGIPIETKITSIRRVDWARFGTNFFVIFPPQTLREAPQTFVALARVDSAADRTALQRELVTMHSNVSVIDLAQVQKTLEDTIGKVTLGVRFMALFSILAGVVVLTGAISTSRFQRIRESVLLKALGATRAQIIQILLTEYLALGMLAGLGGVMFASVAGWAITKWVFELEFVLPILQLGGAWLGVAGIAVLIGLLNSRDVLKRTPLAVLRET